jgi:hypothetical protein
VIDSYDHETSIWPQIYDIDPDFDNTYQLLGVNTTVTNFHIQDEMLFHMVHLYVPSSEQEEMILEDHYSWVVGNFSGGKRMAVLQQHFY